MVRHETPSSLDGLAGPSRGVVELPRILYWGPEKSVDLSDCNDVQRMYHAVVRTGTAAEQDLWLNRDLLVSDWHELVLPVQSDDAIVRTREQSARLEVDHGELRTRHLCSPLVSGAADERRRQPRQRAGEQVPNEVIEFLSVPKSPVRGVCPADD